MKGVLKKTVLVALLAALVGTIPIWSALANDSNSKTSQKRVLVIQKKSYKLENDSEIDSVLNKYKHKKVKRLKYLKGAEVIIVDETEFQILKLDNELQVFEDAVVKVPKPKLCKLNEPQQMPWGIKCIKAEKAWGKTAGKNVKVAVIDSGIEHHKDLYKNIKGEFNAIDPEIPAIDEQGHGTHVAGIIAAENNHTGVVGVAPNVSLYAVKVLDAYGLGYLSDVTEGIEWCINNEIDIINLSFDTKEDMPILRDSITRAIDARIIVVSVAGNTYGGNTTYPATYDGVISVSAFDKNFNVAEFSATGKIDFCEPGVEILSTYLNDKYSTLSGTSMAAPHVTGVLALILANRENDLNHDGKVSVQEVKELLPRYTKDIGAEGYDDIFGNGVLNAIYKNKF